MSVKELLLQEIQAAVEKALNQWGKEEKLLERGQAFEATIRLTKKGSRRK